MTHTPIDVLLIGAGMHVSGRGTSGYGTVLPAVVQAHREGLIGRVLVAVTSVDSIRAVEEKMAGLNSVLGTRVAIEGFPKSGRHPAAYQEALAALGKRGCVIIVVPDDLHFVTAKAAIERRYPVMVTKPLVPTLAEARELVSLTQTLGVYGVVDFHKRWDLPNLKLRDTIQAGRLGNPLFSVVEYSQRRIVPETIFRSWVEQANPFQYMAVHYVDILIFTLGATPRRAMAIGQHGYLKERSINTYDSVQAFVEWGIPGSDVPFLSTFITNWIDPNTTAALSYQSIKVIGTSGRFESDQRDRGLHLVTEADGTEVINPYFTQTYPSAQGPYREYKGYGIDSIRAFLED
ncbi:MAG TPA: Gfo/Idh/MocA family oxidoreductase, partial [Candidatus Methylomirabilis sp.]|nr:Gfo/Idh/MocA family oxidoreductase [Candidatus Methylomirabilis sp.]